MPESLAGADHVALGVDDYFADFWERFGHLDGDLWKLERRQEFREPGYPSWDSFAAGRVADSLALAEAGRVEILDYQRRLFERHIESRRVRVAASPPTPYLWWESHILKIRTRNTATLEVLLGEIQRWPGVIGTRTNLVLSTHKETLALPLSHLEEIIAEGRGTKRRGE